jgi:hypothetical protein
LLSFSSNLFLLLLLLIAIGYLIIVKYTGCLKIRKFRIEGVVGGTSVVQTWKLKKIGTPPTKIHWSEDAVFEVRFLHKQVEKFSVYCYLWCR